MSVLTAACIISDDGGTCSGRDSCMDGILVGDFSGRLCGDGFSSDCIKCNFSDDRYDFQLCIGDDFVVAWCVYFDSLLGKDGTGPQDCDLLFESDRKQATQSGGVLVFTDCDFVDSSAKCSGMRDDHTDCSIDAQLCW